WRGQRVPGFASEVDESDVWQRRADPAAQRETVEALPALWPRRRASVDRDRTFECSALRSHGARVVAWVGVLLVRAVVLLVDDDEADVAHRRKQGRAGADDYTRLPGRDPDALVAPLGGAQRGVQDR